MGYLTELMPTTGNLLTNRNDYASMYDHAMEEVHPWYHRVILDDYSITADWTTTERSVIYRFDFSDNDSCNIIFRYLQIIPTSIFPVIMLSSAGRNSKNKTVLLCSIQPSV